MRSRYNYFPAAILASIVLNYLSKGVASRPIVEWLVVNVGDGSFSAYAIPVLLTSLVFFSYVPVAWWVARDTSKVKGSPVLWFFIICCSRLIGVVLYVMLIEKSSDEGQSNPSLSD
jgi:general stress protein CsbA